VNVDLVVVLNKVADAVVSLNDSQIAFATRCLQPPVLAPVRRGEGRG